jgi:hypothetical protein
MSPAICWRNSSRRPTSGARVKKLAEKIEGLRKKRGQYDAILKQLERTGEDQISLTDPDSRAMAAHTRVAVGYNVQVAVDAKRKLIVEQEVTNWSSDSMKPINWRAGLSTQDCSIFGRSYMIRILEAVV